MILSHSVLIQRDTAWFKPIIVQIDLFKPIIVQIDLFKPIIVHIDLFKPTNVQIDLFKLTTSCKKPRDDVSSTPILL